jgi:hypothetical protein
MTQIPDNGGPFGDEGMTLRDWFAGQALAALIQHYEGDDGSMDGIPTSAYEYADAMIEARKGGSE